MKTYEIILREKREIAQGTYDFIFDKPQGFSYHAGQYISLCVERPEIAIPLGTMRELSLVSAPFEDVLTLAIRYRDTPAKVGFIKLKTGDKAYLQGPFGDFHIHPDDSAVIMLAGGIGIVPFISMLRQALHEGDTRSFYLFYSNRQQEDIPYLPELRELMNEYKNFTLITTLTGASHVGHESGYISPLLIKKILNPTADIGYYLSGPQRFVGGMWDVLERLTIPARQIHGEEFTGY